MNNYLLLLFWFSSFIRLRTACFCAVTVFQLNTRVRSQVSSYLWRSLTDRGATPTPECDGSSGNRKKSAASRAVGVFSAWAHSFCKQSGFRGSRHNRGTQARQAGAGNSGQESKSSKLTKKRKMHFQAARPVLASQNSVQPFRLDPAKRLNSFGAKSCAKEENANGVRLIRGHWGERRVAVENMYSART